jgi:hypothetical protein
VVLIATPDLDQTLDDLRYVDPMTAIDDPVLYGLREVLGAEAAGGDTVARRKRYIGWLGASAVHALFGGEALARDEWPDGDSAGEAAAALARAVEHTKDTFVRVSLVEWMWSGVYPSTTVEGRVALVNATLRGAADPAEDLRRQCLDKLAEMDPAILEEPGLLAVPAAAPHIANRIAEESDGAARARLERVLELVRR